MFDPIRTDRLLLRQAEIRDAEQLATRRSDPDVARYQNWKIPYPTDRALQMVTEVAGMDGPANDEWWMASVCDPDDDLVLGDLALHLSSESRTAEIGYTFSTEHWGKGYAIEALSSLIPYLFDTIGVTRIFGMLHPDNPASAMVMERCGFLYEGHTRASFWIGEDNSDDVIYGMTRPDWDGWVHRPSDLPETLQLVEITPENQRVVAALVTHKSQERFVAPVQKSFGDALFPEVVDGAPVVPWLRAVKADGEYVGFVMVAAKTKAHPEPYLWRLLIDRLHQRRGIGRRVLDLVAEECRSTMGATSLLTSWATGKGSPEAFYLGYGFEPTGEIVEEETEARLPL